MNEANQPRREFVKRGVYKVPAILTLMAAPGFAKAGSVKPPRDDHDQGHDPHRPPKKWNRGS